MSWDWPAAHTSHQPSLPFSPPELPISRQTIPEKTDTRPALETQLINLLTEKQPRSFEDLITLTHQPIPSISVALLNLEIKGIIRSLPGRHYHLAC
jgi:predicted Rossmann fold nucleotide-binding protein DprA/Smf involved in DNA uptake